MDRNQTRRQFLQVAGAAAAVGVAGCSDGDGGATTSTTAATTAATDSPFPSGSCLAAMTESLPTPDYGFEFSDGLAPEVGSGEAAATGDVSVTDGVATFGESGGEIRVEDVPAVGDFVVSLFASPAVAATDQWDVMLWYSPVERQWAGWGVEHGKGAVDFWVEGPEQSSTEVLTESSSALPVDAWTHVVGVKRGNQTTLYVDGEQVAASALDFSGISYGGADTVDMFLGRHGGSGVGDRHYHGDLDSVALWSGGLSEDDVATLLQQGGACR